jgi:hypothetical protein
MMKFSSSDDDAELPTDLELFSSFDAEARVTMTPPDLFRNINDSEEESASCSTVKMEVFLPRGNRNLLPVLPIWRPFNG